KVALELKTSKHLEVLGGAKQTVDVAEMHESSAVFKVRATNALGSGNFTFIASLGDRSSKLSTDLSVRPPVPYMTTLQAGHLEKGETEVKVTRRMVPEF